MQSIKKVYFPNLNGLRFFAAFIVLFRHIEQFKLLLGQPSINFRFGPTGHLCVLFFFTLSGFIISYLLLNEKRVDGAVSIKTFYARRCRRIFPLYYLIIMTGIFLIPALPFYQIPVYSSQIYIHFDRKLLLFLLLLSNVYFVIYPFFPYIAHTWSIAVEEQFYLFWPWIIKYSGNYLKVFLSILLLGIALSNGFGGWVITVLHDRLSLFSHNNSGMIINYINSFFELFRMDCFAMGALGAAILIKGPSSFLKIIFKPVGQIFIYSVFIILIIFEQQFNLNDIVYCFLLMLIILNLAGNKTSLVNLENRWLNYLGKISYGLYMFHPFVILLLIKSMVIYSNGVNNVFSNLLLYILSPVITILIAWLSFERFEKKFLYSHKGE